VLAPFGTGAKAEVAASKTRVLTEQFVMLKHQGHMNSKVCILLLLVFPQGAVLLEKVAALTTTSLSILVIAK
jgi:hypothetical protein